jgi:hypothetical protein
MKASTPFLGTSEALMSYNYYSYQNPIKTLYKSVLNFISLIRYLIIYQSWGQATQPSI